MAYTPSSSQAVFKISTFKSESFSGNISRYQNRNYFKLFPQNPKILLLEPFYPLEAAWGSLKVEAGYLTPLGVTAIYRWLKEKNYDVEFFDTQFGQFDADGLKKYLKDGQYDLIGLPVFTPTASYAFETAGLIREVLPDCIIVYGGVHVTDMSVESLEESPESDFIIRREGEFTIVDLIEALKAGKKDFSDIDGLTWRKNSETVIVNPDRALIPDLDETPLGIFGDLDLTAYIPHATQYVKLPHYSIFTQRGCPYPCTFCEASTALGKQLRVFSPKRVIEELKILKYKKGARGIYFQDSTFTMHRKYVVDLLTLMIKEGLSDLRWVCNTRTDRVDKELLALMYESGCRTIAYGIESANQQSLNVLKKNIKVEKQEEGVNLTHKARISMNCSYILCVPGETEEMVQNTINYAKRLGSQIASFYLPVPYPGSELYKVCKETGGLRDTKIWSEYLSIDFDNPVYINPLIGKERMKYFYKKSYREYYSSPNVLFNSLKSLLRNGGMHRYWRGIKVLRELIFAHKDSDVVSKLQPQHEM